MPKIHWDLWVDWHAFRTKKCKRCLSENREYSFPLSYWQKNGSIHCWCGGQVSEHPMPSSGALVLMKAMANALVLMPPILGKPLILYIVVEDELIGCLFAQDPNDGTKRSMYYLSSILNDVETRYTPTKKLCLSLFYACTKLECYLLPKEILVLSEIDILK